MKYLVEVAKTVAEGVSLDEMKQAREVHRAEIDGEVGNVSDEDLLVLVEALFGREPRTDKSFYDVLTDFQHSIGYGPAYSALGGRIWASAFMRLPPERGLELLSGLLADDQRSFWTGIRCLPTFCTIVELPAAFAAKWFHDLGTRVAGNWAGGDFYNAICRYAETFPESALAIFEHYVSQDLDPLTAHLAALLLGTARAKSALGKVSASRVRRWDAKLQRSKILQQRLMYDKSLVCSFNLGTLSIRQLRAKLARMLDGTPEEVSESFDVMGRCLGKDRGDTEFTRFALEWYKRNSSPALPDFAKLHLVEALWLLCASKDVSDRAYVVSRANDLLILIQPIPHEHEGTWHELESYLRTILDLSRSEFDDVFSRLVKSNPAGVLEQMKGRGFLKGELARAHCEEIVTKLLLSAEVDEWEVGKSIFANGAIRLSDEVLSKTGEIQLEIALRQFMRSPFLAKATSQYLSQLEPYFRKVSPDLQNAFRNELAVQAMNYRGACLEAWKTPTAVSPLMSGAVERAEKYFDDLSKVRDSPAVSFVFPGYASAGRKADRVFSGKMRRQAMEKSVFARFARHFEIMYGDRWATFMGGRLDGPSSFSEHRGSIELPRLEVIDPEGMAIRRLTASARIKELRGEIK